MYTAKDSNTERTGDTSKRQRLKTFRIGLSKDFVNASGTVGAEFKTNFDDANPTTPLADISKSVYKVGAYEASNSSWTKLSSGEELFSSGRMDDMPVLGNCRGDNTFSISLNGTIPTGVSNAPFHVMYRISSDSYNFVTGSEETTLSFTYYLTSYNKGELRNALAKYEGTGLVSSSFDAAKWSDYLAAYKNAKKILGDEITTQLSIDAAKAKLDRAYAKLFDSDTAGGALPPTEINSGLSLEPVVNNSGANKDKPVTRVLRNSSDNDIGYVYYGTADAYATQSFFYIKATNHSLEPVTVTKLTSSNATVSIALPSGGQTIASGESAYFKVAKSDTPGTGDYTVTATYKMDILPEGTSTGVNADKEYEAVTYFRVLSYATAFSAKTHPTTPVELYDVVVSDDTDNIAESFHGSSFRIQGSVKTAAGSPSTIGARIVSTTPARIWDGTASTQYENSATVQPKVTFKVNKDKYSDLIKTGLCFYIANNDYQKVKSTSLLNDVENGWDNGSWPYKIFLVQNSWSNGLITYSNTSKTAESPIRRESSMATVKTAKNKTEQNDLYYIGTNNATLNSEYGDVIRRRNAAQGLEDEGKMSSFGQNKVSTSYTAYPSAPITTTGSKIYASNLSFVNYGKDYFWTWQSRAAQVNIELTVDAYSASAIAELVNECNNTAFISAKYDSTLWSNYKTALKNATNVLGAYGQTQSVYDERYTALSKAFEALKSQTASTYAANVYAVDHNVWEGRAKTGDCDGIYTKYYLVNHGNTFAIPFIDGSLPSAKFRVDSSEAKGVKPTVAAVSDKMLSVTAAGYNTGDRYFNYDYWSSAYTVTFVNEDGSVIGTQTRYYGDLPDYEWDAPVKANTNTTKYDWAGWVLQKKDSDGNNVGDAVNVGFELRQVGGSDAKGTAYEYKAKFDESAATYKVAFLTHDGSAYAGDAATSVFEGKHYNEAVTYTVNNQTRDGARTGYYWVWDGWSTADSSSSDYDSAKVSGMTNATSGTVAVTDDAIYYAHFSEKAYDYKINYVLDGGTNAAGNPTSYTVEDEITLAAPTKTGYRFIGWKEGDTIAKGSTGDKTFTAQWEALDVNYTVIHEREALNGTYGDTALTETETLTGKSGAKTAAAAKSYEGFTAQTFSQQTISGDGSTTVTIRYTRKTFTVKYVADGKTLQTDNGVKFGASTPAYTGETPTKTGYTFVGWGEIASTVTADATYEAVFEKNTYSVIYNAGDGKFADGSTEKTVSVKFGDSIPSFTETPVANKAGYHFDKWSGSIPETMGSENITVTALYAPDTNTVYKVETYKMKVDGSGYEMTDKSFNGTTDTEAAVTAEAVEGFTFNAAKSVLSGNIAGDGSFVLKIYYDRNQYDLTVDNDNGDEVKTAKIYYGASVSVSTPTKTGYTFDKWNNTVPATMPAGDVSLKALWKINRYTITFNTNGGSDTASITQDYGTKITAPADPTKEGHTFAGWDKEIPSTMPAENITINAKWNVNKYTITFDSDGGSDVAPMTFDYGAAVTAPTAPTKQGYTFAGWDAELPETMPAKDLTFKAKWTADTDTKYTVRYWQQNIDNDEYTLVETVNSNGTTGEVINVEIKSYDGFKAVGSYDGITIAADGSTTVDVKYDRLTYTVEYKYTGKVPSDASALPENATYRYGATVKVAPNATAEGYDFSGWSRSDFIIGENVTIDGSFTVRAYAIDYVLDGGTNSAGNPTSYTVEDEVTLEAPTRAGYDFAGWSDGGRIAKGSTGAKTFVASWTARKDNSGTVYYKCGDTEIAPAKALTGLETDAIHTEQPIEIAGYTAPAAQTVTVKAGDGNDIIFNYTAIVDGSRYTVNYYLKGTETALAESVTLNATAGKTVTAEHKEIDGYTYDASSVDSAIVKGDNSTVINLYYTAKTDIKATVQFVDENGNALAEDVVKENLTMATEFTYAPVEIAGYVTPEQQTIVLAAYDNVITYVYKAKTDIKATVRFVDENDNALADDVVKENLTMATEFTYAPVEIAGYVTPAQQTITLKADGNVIVYTYVAIENALNYNVEYIYVDGGEEVAIKASETKKATGGKQIEIGSIVEAIGGYTYDHATVNGNTATEFTVVHDNDTTVKLYYIIKDGQHEDDKPDSGDWYTVTLKDGDEVLGKIEYNVRTDITIDDIAKTGYVFNGWIIESTDGNWGNVGTNLGRGTGGALNIGTGRYGHVTLNADWLNSTDNYYKIVYYYGTTKVSDDVHIKAATGEVISLTPAEKTVFNGDSYALYTDKGNYDNGTTVAADGSTVIEIYYGIDKNDNGTPDDKDPVYTVTYKYNGQTATEEVLTGLAPSAVPSKETLNAAAPDGQCFKEWDGDVTAKIESDTTFTAIYAEDKNGNDIPDDEEAVYTVTYKYNGQTATEEVLTGLAPSAVPSKETLNAAAPDGQCFKEWDGDVTAKIESDTIFTAIYAEDKNGNDIPDDEEAVYTVTYKYNGQTATEEVLTGLAPSAVPSKETLNAAAPDGQCFKKWDGDVTAKIESDTTFTAIYAEDKNGNDIPDDEEAVYTVTYKYNGQTATEEVLTGLAPSAVPSKETLNAAAPDGQCFKKWDGDVTAKIESDTTFTAIYAEDKNGNAIPDDEEAVYTVTYKYNGQTATEEVLTGLTPSAVPSKETLNAAAPDGQCFKEWDGDVTAKIESDTTFTAIYAEDKNGNAIPDDEEAVYTVTYKYNGQTATEEVLTGLTPSAVPSKETLNAAAPDGQCFKEWDGDVTAKIESDTTFTAIYAEDKNGNDIPDDEEAVYTVTYKYNGQTATEEVLTGLAPSAVPSKETLNAAAPDGQCFKEWDGDVTAKIESDTTFTAIYAEDKNGNDIPDDEEAVYTVTYKYNGQTATEEVLTGLAPSAVPSKETLNAAAPDGQCFKEWDGDVTAKIESDTTFTAIYAEDKNGNDIPDDEEAVYKLTVKLVYADGTKAADDHVEEVLYGVNYSYTAPKKDGYVAVPATVSGIMPENDVEETIVYKVDKNNNGTPDEDEFHKLVINYVYADGSEAAETYAAELKFGTAYDVESPKITDFVADKLNVTGEMGLEDIEVTVTYKEDKNNNGQPDEDEFHKLVINYVYADGSKAAETYAAELKFGTAYDVESPEIAGYEADKAVVSGTMDIEDITVTVTYTGIENALNYNVEYIYVDGGEEVAIKASETKKATGGKQIEIGSIVEAIGGYTYDHATVNGNTATEFTVVHDNDTTVKLYYIIKDGQHEDDKPDSGDHYKITYNADGGELGGEYTTEYTVRDSVTLPTVIKTGYIFTGWQVSKVENASANSWELGANLGSDTYALGSGHYGNVTLIATWAASDSTKYTVVTVYGSETVTETKYGKTGDVISVDAAKWVDRNGTTYLLVSKQFVPEDGKISADGSSVVTLKYKVDSNKNEIPDDEETYTLTVKLVYADGTSAGDNYVASVLQGEEYSYTAPKKDGYVAVPATVSGTMPENDVEETIVYKVDKNNNGQPDEDEFHKLVINYVYADGSKAAETYAAELKFGTAYDVESPKITDFVADKLNVTGEMGLEDIEVTVTYKADKNNNGTPDEDEFHKLVINYVYADGSEAAETYAAELKFGTAYDVESPKITDFVADKLNVAGEMGLEDIEVTVTYKADKNNNGQPDEDEFHKLVINYVYADGSKAAETYAAELKFGTAYDVESPEIAGYEADKAAVSGTMDIEDITVTVTYTANQATVTFRYMISAHDEKVVKVKVTLGETVPTADIPTVETYHDGDYDVEFVRWSDSVTEPINSDKEFVAVTRRVFVPADYELDRTAERADFKGFNDAEELAERLMNEYDLRDDIVEDLNKLISDGYVDAESDPRTVYGQAHQDEVNAAEKAIRDYIIGLDKDRDGEIDDDFIKKYTVTFMVGDVAGATVTVKKGESAKYPSDASVTLTREANEALHFVFTGFGDGENFWSGDTVTDVTSDITVYALFEAEPHRGGSANCKHKAVCEVCGTEYGELVDHRFVTVPAQPATCTEKGHNAYERCTVCGTIRGDAGFTDALGHDVDFSHVHSTGTADDGSYTWKAYKCIRCNYKEVVITIIALDENGNPISGAEVKVGDESGTTDENGKFTTKPLGDGEYNVSVDDKNGQFKGDGTLYVNDGNVTGSFTNGTGKLHKYTCGKCLCHRNNIFGKVLRWLCTLFSVLFRKHIKCCPDMQWYGGLIKWLT